MKVAITGVAGFLGSHLADRMLADGHSVAGCDNLMGGYRDNVPDGVEFFQADCRDLKAMRDTVAGADVVYHCAATAYEGLSVFSPLVVTDNIVTSSVSVITASVDCDVRRFVLCSSMARYGSRYEPPFEEDHMAPAPQDPYGIGKVAAEMYLANLAETHGMEYVIAVPHNIIGPRQKYDDPYRNVASIMINRMLQGKQPIIYGDGNQKRCFSYVDDDVPLLAAMATADVDKQVINIGPDEAFVTINGLAAEIADLIGFKLDPIYVKGRPREVRLANCSADKARRLFGYKTRYSLREGLIKTIEYIEKRGPRPFDYAFDLEINSSQAPKTWRHRMI